MSGSSESVRWSACVRRLDLGIYSHPTEFGGNGVRNHVNTEGKIPSTVTGRPSSEPPVEEIFPLELTWVLTPFPKTLSDESIN